MVYIIYYILQYMYISVAIYKIVRKYCYIEYDVVTSYQLCSFDLYSNLIAGYAQDDNDSTM